MASRLPKSKVGLEAPTCSSSSKPPRTAVHVLAEAPRPTSKQLVQGMSVNKSTNIAFDLEWSSLRTSTRIVVQQGIFAFISLSLRWTAALGTGMHYSVIYFEAIQLWTWLSSLSSTGNNFLSTNISNRMAWLWAESLVEIGGILADIRGTTK